MERNQYAYQESLSSNKCMANYTMLALLIQGNPEPECLTLYKNTDLLLDLF